MHSLRRRNLSCQVSLTARERGYSLMTFQDQSIIIKFCTDNPLASLEKSSKQRIPKQIWILSLFIRFQFVYQNATYQLFRFRDYSGNGGIGIVKLGGGNGIVH